MGGTEVEERAAACGYAHAGGHCAGDHTSVGGPRGWCEQRCGQAAAGGPGRIAGPGGPGPGLAGRTRPAVLTGRPAPRPPIPVPVDRGRGERVAGLAGLPIRSAAGSARTQLIYMPGTGLGPDPGSAIAATITRASDRELTASFLPASIGLGYRALRWQVISSVSGPGCVWLRWTRPAARRCSRPDRRWYACTPRGWSAACPPDPIGCSTGPATSARSRSRSTTDPGGNPRPLGSSTCSPGSTRRRRSSRSASTSPPTIHTGRSSGKCSPTET